MFDDFEYRISLLFIRNLLNLFLDFLKLVPEIL